MNAARAARNVLLVSVLAFATNAAADPGIDADARAALKKLYKVNSAAKIAAGKATAILVFPNIKKAGLMVGAQFGDGSLLDAKGKVLGHYRSMAGSYGYQAGAQSFSYALFFMNKASLAYLDKSDGWEVGVGPSIVVVDEGVGKSMTSSTLTQDIYAFIWGQSGLMAGLGIQGSKITKIK